MGEQVISGACLCGAVRFEVAGPLDRVAHCHCTICQRAHGAAFVTWAAVPDERVRITSGEADVTHYRSSEIGTRSFCRTCGSSMFCTLDTHPGVIDVALACLTPEHGAVPRAHLFWDDRAGWIELTDGLPRLGGKSGMEPRWARASHMLDSARRLIRRILDATGIPSHPGSFRRGSAGTR